MYTHVLQTRKIFTKIHEDEDEDDTKKVANKLFIHAYYVVAARRFICSSIRSDVLLVHRVANVGMSIK